MTPAHTTATPLVSVIIPAYGRPDYLRAAIESVLQGGHDNTEIIVVDDGSPTPIELRIVDFIESGAVRLLRKENGGTAQARNFGAQHANGPLLLFLDDDDLVIAGSIGTRVRALQQRDNAGVVFGRFSSFRTGEEPFVIGNELPEAYIDRWMMMERNELVSPGVALVRAEDFRAVGGFASACPGSDDWDLWMRLATVRPLWRMTERMLAYRLHEGNVSNRVAFMASGAMLAALRAGKLACRKHSPTATYLTSAYVEELYAGKLERSILERQQAHDTTGAARDAMVRRNVHVQFRTARIRFRLSALLRSGKFVVRGGPMTRTGRDCHKCTGIRVHPNAE